MNLQAITVVFVLISTLILLFFEALSPEMVMFGALVFLWGVGIIDDKDALNGFSNQGMLTVGALFIVAAALKKSGIVDNFSRKVSESKINILMVEWLND